MPKRITSKRVKSDKVQGAGSWVEYKPFTYGERLELDDERALHVAQDEDEGSAWARASSERLVVEHILAWNWVDDNGEPLPLPSADPTVVHRLNDVEMGFINTLFRGEDPK